MSARILFVGAGDLAARCVAALGGPLADASCIGLRRDPSLLGPAFTPLAADYSQPASAAAVAAQEADFVVVTCKPAGRDRAGYRRGFADAARQLAAGLRARPPRALLFVSSSRVYAERDGGWVSEDSALAGAAEDPAAAEIVAAEDWLRAAELPLTVLRCAGIYGAANGYLQRRVATGSLTAPRPLRYSNRIHRDDVGGFLAFLLAAAAAGERLRPVYNVVDDCPAPQAEVERWLADRLGVSEALRSDAARPPARGHKRLANARLRGSGYQLRYPDYRAGYAAALAARGA